MRLPFLVAALLLAAPATAAAEPAVSLPGSVAATESAGTIRIPVTLSEPAPVPVGVSWRTMRPLIADAPMALAGVDYTEGSGTLEFAPGETSEELAVTVHDDAVDDNSPLLGVELHDPQGATLGPQRSVAFEIADDEPTPPASLSDVTVREGAGEALVPLARPGISLLGAAAYAWTPRPGTARAPQDFAAASGRGFIGYGKLATVARVAIADDDRGEPDESFELVLAPDPTAVRPFSLIFAGPVADAVATITITDDDLPGPVVTVRRVSGRIRVAGRRLRGTAPLARGDRVDARRGAARITVARGGAVLRAATVAGGRVRLTRADDLRMASSHLLVGSRGGMGVRARAVRTDPVTPRARWILRERAAGTQVRVLAGRVKAGAAVLRPGPPRLFGRR
jgi:hypothetical protein